MKIIDLLNKIANGEEVPQKIKIDSCIYTFEWSEKEQSYYDEKNEVYILDVLYSNQDDLTREIEILDDDDEEKGLPEKIDTSDGISVANCAYKINEIIDYLEKQSKGE